MCPCKFSPASFCSVYFFSLFAPPANKASAATGHEQIAPLPPLSSMSRRRRGELDVVHFCDIHPTARGCWSKKWPEPIIVSTMLMAYRSPVFFRSWLKNRPTRDALPPNGPPSPRVQVWLLLRQVTRAGIIGSCTRSRIFSAASFSINAHREEHLTSAVTGAAPHRSSHDAFQSRLARKIE